MTGSKRLIIVSPSLSKYGGHSYNQAAGFVQAARSRGLVTRVLANREVDHAIREELQADAVFSLGAYRTSHLAQRAIDERRIELTAKLAAQVREDLESLGDIGLGADDIIYHDGVSEYTILGLAQWLSGYKWDSAPGVFVYLATPDMLDENGLLPNRSAPLYQDAIDALVAATAEDKVFITNSLYAVGVDPRQAAVGREVHTFPFPKNYHCPEFPPHLAGDDGQITVSFLGGVERRKNSHLIPEIVACCQKSGLPLRFFVQCFAAGDYCADLRDQVASELSCLPEVEVEAVTLTRDQYLQRLLATDILVLPQDPKLYKVLTSGIFAEAVAFGIPVVAGTGTWMHEVLKAGYGAGTIFDRPTAPAIAEAVLEAQQMLEALRATAAESADKWRMEQSVAAYLERMIKLCD